MKTKLSLAFLVSWLLATCGAQPVLAQAPVCREVCARECVGGFCAWQCRWACVPPQPVCRWEYNVFGQLVWVCR